METNKPLEQMGNMAYIGDGISLSLIVGTVANILPGVAALLAIVWTAIRIYETCTVQRFLYGSDCTPGDKDG